MSDNGLSPQNNQGAERGGDQDLAAPDTPGVAIRPAVAGDLPAIVGLLADDPLGRLRDDAAAASLDPAYTAAFAAIDADPNQILAVMAADGGRIVGTAQITFLPGLSRKGAWRGQIEAVRVAADLRSRGLGERLMAWAVERCRERGCRLVQLASDKTRLDAHRFYGRLGFAASHEGFKLYL
ncbi:MAG: GNAT family N-acetyltransferase [Rhodospirillaceae bacterium]|nr:GNAT family N-acetyltransferase [Rhodospirillaceae bacterium]MCA8931583.1 GNAT family N-acetyltransferase [Rhodospirillaceae bacterium]